MKILLIQTSFLGDTILSTPVIAGLKSLYPQADLWMMTTPAAVELIRRDPLLSGTIVFDKSGRDRGLSGLKRKAAQLKEIGFDRVYSLHRSWRTALLVWFSNIRCRTGFVESSLSWVYQTRITRKRFGHDVERNLAILTVERGIDSFESSLRIFSPSISEVSESIRPYLTAPKPIIMVPGSVWATKRWSWLEYRQVAKKLIEQGNQVLVLGSPKEEEVCANVCQSSGAINLAGKTDLGSMLALMAHARLVICNDSMALHLASAFKIPSVAIFCSTVPEFGFGPWQNRAEVLGVSGLSCRPCSRHGTMRCPTGTEKCMTGISSDQVMASVTRLI